MRFFNRIAHSILRNRARQVQSFSLALYSNASKHSDQEIILICITSIIAAQLGCFVLVQNMAEGEHLLVATSSITLAPLELGTYAECMLDIYMVAWH